jgi:prophage regulatory protein
MARHGAAESQKTGMKFRFESYPDLRDRGITYSRPQLWRMEKAGRFPKRVKLNGLRVVWMTEEIDAWQAAQVAARGNGRAA